MENHFQHLTATQCNELLKLLQKYEELFDGTLVTWKTDTLEFKLKENAKPIFLQPYPVLIEPIGSLVFEKPRSRLRGKHTYPEIQRVGKGYG